MVEKRKMDQLGEKVLDALGSPMDDERRAAQEVAVMELARQLPERGVLRGRPRRWALVAGAAGVVGVVAVVAVVAMVGRGLGDSERSLIPSGVATRSFRVQGQEGSGSGSGAVGMWLSSRPGQPVRVDFAGGSRFVLEDEGLAQVAEASRAQVTIRLDQGRLQADVRRKADAAWDVTAGPYRVTVQGTRFTVVWDAKRTELVVTVTRGRVLVSGTGIGSGGIVVKARRELRVDRRGGELSLRSLGTRANVPATAPAPGTSAAPAPDPEPDPEAVLGPALAAKTKPVPGVGPGAGPGASKGARPVAAWRVALKAGRFGAAIAAAEKQGFASLTATLSAGDLWRLARACRYARKGRRATEAFRAYRRRFPGTNRARRAAFLVGRVHLELRRRPAAASRWFATYLKESPRGPLAEEALGRYMDAAHKAGHTAAAAAAAKRYLARYKTGIFRNLAQTVLRRSGMR